MLKETLGIYAFSAHTNTLVIMTDNIHMQETSL